MPYILCTKKNSKRIIWDTCKRQIYRTNRWKYRTTLWSMAEQRPQEAQMIKKA